jgi:hypothetical protein
VLKNRDSGDVSQSLYHDDVVDLEGSLRRSKEIERANRSSAKSHWKTVHRTKALIERSWRKVWPSPIGFTQRVVDDGFTVSKTVHAGAFIGLNLKEFEYSHRLAGGSHELQFPPGRGQHHASGVDVDGLDAAIGEDRENVNHVIVVHEIVGEFDERCD